MKCDPLVSVVMPNYNTPEGYLRAAVESVLSQTYPNIELIIVDDASDGNDLEVIGSYRDCRINLLRNDNNMHVAHSLNKAIEAANGEFIARMDSDDVCLPRRIEKQARFLMRHDDTDILSARARFTGARKGVYAAGLLDPKMAAEMFFVCPVFHPTVMFRASFLKENALRYSEDDSFKAAEDYELWSRCVFLGNMREYPETLLLYRAHERQVSSASAELQRAGANRVRARMLSKIGIIPDGRETDTHYRFCNEIIPESFEETHEWAQKLLGANETYKAFDKIMFKRAVLRRLFVIAVKSLLAKKISAKEAFSWPLLRSALLPDNYPGIIGRYVFSKRLNRKDGPR